MYKPLIIITTSRDEEYGGARLRDDYSRCITQAGGIPLLLPKISPDDAAELSASADGLLLSGGGDIDPDIYGQLPLLSPRSSDPERDTLELALFDAFWERRLPILGICRGCQLINIARGGTLFQDIKMCCGRSFIRHDQAEERHSATHRVALISRELQTLFGGETLPVNSLHHQAVDQPGHGLRVAARSEDLVIEAVSARESSRFCLGVQWHPECLPAHAPIFDSFVAACTDG